MYQNKICVVGAGYWGKNHISTLFELGCLGGIVEENPDIIKYFKRKYPKTPTYQKLDNALKSNDSTGFIVATPADTHYSIAKEIILAKKHVLVEKPFTLNLEDAQNLKRLSKKYNTNIMVGHVLLFHPAIKKIKQLITEGKIGKLQYIYSNRLNLGQVRTQENVFWSLAPHDVSIFQYFTDSYPVSIKTIGSTFLQRGIHDSTITQLKYPNLTEGHIFVSWLHPFKEHRLVVIGSEAMISFDDTSESKPLKLYSKNIDIKDGIPIKNDGPIEEIKYETTMPLTEELRCFIRHLDGSRPIIADINHACEVTNILVHASKQLEA